MDRETLLSFIKTAEAALISVRGSLLLISQRGAKLDLAPLAAQLANIAEIAGPLGLESLAEQADHCKNIVAQASDEEKACVALDAIPLLEAELMSVALSSEIVDVGAFVEGSFHELFHETKVADASPQFSIDEETLEIFRSEGEELLANISLAIDMLAASPADQSALWDIRRSAHTFKGAAGIVGLTEAASLAHRMEDLLDRLVQSKGSASTGVLDFLRGCIRSLNGVLDGHPANAAGLELAYSSAVSSLNGLGSQPAAPEHLPKTPTQQLLAPKPVVRMSLERHTEIVALTEQLLRDHTRLHPETRSIVAEIHERLLGIRLIKFSNLETRFARAVNLTATEEGKKAVLEIETPDVEIDTLILDALVEPLLHLIKNAIVHGIEPPELRRMLGKHEFGLVSIRVEADNEAIVVAVSDDGSGLAIDKLKYRAVQRGLISNEQADTMSDRQAYQLLFDKGLTTTENVTLNAGRGVGMSIVKESVESRGGSIHIRSTQQLGTTFTLMLPVQLATPRVSITPSQPAPESPLVLIVDDSASIRRHTQMIVEEAGLRSITAKDGADALELLLNGSPVPDVILSDVEMPNLDGWQLLEYLKTDDNLGHVPVVLVTSLDADKHRALAVKLGAADYIVKPFSANDVDKVLALAAANATA